MPETAKCSAASCECPASALLGVTQFCRSHFISSCYEQLEACRRELDSRHSSDIGEELLSRNLSTCLSAAINLVLCSNDLTNLERAQLFDIVLSAMEASRRLRRSIRKTVSMPVRLTFEAIGRTWTEDSQTRVISRYGACVKCSHPVKVGESLTLERRDTNQRARCRIAWRSPTKDDIAEIGIEFSTDENFWQVDWTSPGRVDLP